MKFIHWTDERNIRRIRRQGIRMSRTRHGTGVYCVPIVAISPASTNQRLHNTFAGRLPSNKKMWRWLVGNRRKTKREAAVIIELSQPDPRRWSDMTVVCSTRLNSLSWRLIRKLMNENAILVSDDHIELAEVAFSQGFGAELTLEILHPNALTRLAACYNSSLFSSRYCDHFEAIVRRPIAAKEIVKIEMRNRSSNSRPSLSS